MTHRMIFNQTGYFGRGAIAHIAPEIARRGLTKAFIVTDPVLADNGTAARITDLLDEAGISWEVFSDVAPNPPIEGDEEASRWYVYHRTDRPCLRCSTPIREALMQNRRLFWCPSCQR